jgi:CHAT domain-containing protein/Tfp pilus assembly protein PilF
MHGHPYADLKLFLTLFLLFSLLTVAPSRQALGRILGPQLAQHPRDAGNEKDAQPLEQGKPIKRELAGGQTHIYRIGLSADQFLRVVVKQDGIDVVAQVLGPDGKQIMEFDSESRNQGEESVLQVTEAAGDYRLVVSPKQKGAPAGCYEIRIEELRAATETDRALHQARTLYEKAYNLRRMGKYDEALPSSERALEIRERVLGPDHRDVAAALNNLAALYRYKGDYAKAEPLYQRALVIKEKALGPEHPDVAGSLNNLANLYYSKGDYAKAEPLYQRALVIWEKALGPEHPDVATSLHNLAGLYYSKGDYPKAEPLFERALAIKEKTLGPEHPDVATPLNNLANLYNSKGDYAKAEPLYQRALAIREKALGPEHPDVAGSLNNLASLYHSKGDYAMAGPLFERALAIREKSLGPEHPAVAYSLNNLANLYYSKGDYAQAEPLFQRALAIREKSLGPEHPAVATSLNDLATLYSAKGDIARAITFQSRANTVGERNLTLNLAIGSERQKLAYLALFSKQTDFTLSLHNQIAPSDPQALDLAFTTLLRRKGRGLDAMTDTIGALRRRAAPEDQAFFDRLAEARSQLAAFTLRESDVAKPDTYRARLKPLEEEVERREAELSVRSAEFRTQYQPVTLAAVQAALPADSVLVEFAVYTPRDLQTDKNGLPHYIAYLLAAQGQPRWVDLGEAAPIDRAIAAWREALNAPLRTDVKRLARAVDEKVMRPVLALAQSGLWETRRLLIAPDGLLNLVPFAALVDQQGRYLVERYSISYLTNGRDLLRLCRSALLSLKWTISHPTIGRDLLRAPVRRPVKQNAVIVAAPNYGKRSRLAQIYFPPLAETAGEAQALKAILPRAKVFTREQATEAAIKRLSSPSILHVATHGFFLRDREPELVGARDEGAATDWSGSPSDQPMKNPLLRSGLALAGVNQRWGSANQEDDGVLTALEAAGLDLWGTKLVVLSGCDTGVGEVKNGEGVYGLRRALVLAGSETQVMSLWTVSDFGTRDLMIEYYKALRRGEGRSDGLRRAQLKMLKRIDRQHPFFWAGFIQSGEWANLDGKR